MRRQFTATVYIRDQERILLVYHKKLQKWLPPGGHVDNNELPTDTAVREAKEETGYDISLISDDHIVIKEANASSLARPYLCLLEEIPAHNGESAHQHIDLIYLGKVVGGKLQHAPNESEEARWFTREELAALKPEEEIFNETLQTIDKVLS